MPARNAVLLRLMDADGCFGWGEAWCNFPPDGCLHKVGLVRDIFGPALVGIEIDSADVVAQSLARSVRRMKLHTGERGPFNHCLAAIDTAVHDLLARRSGRPLADMLVPRPATVAMVYASTPPLDNLVQATLAAVAAGHRAVKIKIGFDPDCDIRTITRIRAALGDDIAIFTDANQGWDVTTAMRVGAGLAELCVGFIEEPLLADAAIEDWVRLAGAIPVPLAAGENIMSMDDFRGHIDAGCLNMVQPDVTKWGGVTGAMAVGEMSGARGVGCSLHYMGSALGLAASLHVRAAIADRNGYVELDVNANPLRTDLGDMDLTVRNGELPVPPGIGMGFVPDAPALRSFTIASCEVR
ncbi:MAG: mandelate racemase/muconate lactonizing enzyme family protein [Alphaproteobacteria bacterium]